MKSSALACSVVLGCAAPDGSSAAQVSLALDQPYGGLTPGLEAPSFGEADVATVPRFVPAYASVLSTTEGTVAISSYRVALLWGHLPPAHDTVADDYEAEGATWSGNASVDVGNIDVVRTLSFDDDDSVAPRALPTVVSFVSHTLPFVDGLLLHVTLPSDTPTLHFSTGVVSADLDLSQLAAGGGSVMQGAGYQGLAVVAWDDTATTCPAGITYGRWVKLAASLGTLRGHVMGADGTDLGYTRGIWGHAEERNANVFFTKSIDMEGNFAAMPMGTYGSGNLHGTWNATTTRGGTITGVYSDGVDDAEGRGVFVEKWTVPCQAL